MKKYAYGKKNAANHIPYAYPVKRGNGKNTALNQQIRGKKNNHAGRQICQKCLTHKNQSGHNIGEAQNFEHNNNNDGNNSAVAVMIIIMVKTLVPSRPIFLSETGASTPGIR